MEDLVSLGINAASGGVLGIVGTVLGRVGAYFERQQNFAQEQKQWAHELTLHELTMKARAQETEMELAITQQAGSWQGLQASIAADAAIGTASHWVINCLRLVRPCLTLLLWLIVACIFMMTKERHIIEAVVLAASAATFWWFGDRAPRPAAR